MDLKSDTLRHGKVVTRLQSDTKHEQGCWETYNKSIIKKKKFN